MVKQMKVPVCLLRDIVKEVRGYVTEYCKRVAETATMSLLESMSKMKQEVKKKKSTQNAIDTGESELVEVLNDLELEDDDVDDASFKSEDAELSNADAGRSGGRLGRDGSGTSGCSSCSSSQSHHHHPKEKEAKEEKKKTKKKTDKST